MTQGGTTEDELRVDRVTVSYPLASGGHVDAIRDLSLALAHSEYVVVVGANGAGKSTLISAVAGSIPTQSGRITIGGRDVQKLSFRQRSRLVARVFQDPSAGVFGELSLEDNMILGMMKGRTPSPFRLARTRERRDLARDLLKDFGRGLDDRVAQEAETLSGGQRQMVALAMAVAQTPRVLLLDEHTSALDPDIGNTVMERTESMVRDNELTTLMVTHNMRQAARFGDRLVIMSRGQIVDEIDGDEKRRLGEDGVVDRFRTTLADEVTDRMLG